MSINSHEWLLGLHAGYAVTEEWLEQHYIPTVKALMNERDKLVAVVDAAKVYFTCEATEHLNPKYFPKHHAVRDALAALEDDHNTLPDQFVDFGGHVLREYRE